MTTTPLEIVEYYQNLLISQYNGMPNAAGTIGATAAPIIMCQTSVQTLAFSDIATSGAFVLSYDDVSSASIAWNDSAGTIETKLRAIPGLSAVTVTGSIAGELLTITFDGVNPSALSLVVESNSLLATATPISITVAETDETLPLAVQNGFNLVVGTTTAIGSQLDILGKYVGVSRSGVGFANNITLDDSDYLSLIRMKIILNAAQSDLSTIQNFLVEFFPDEIIVWDHKNMTMDYYISSLVGSNDLVQLFITQNLLPDPMTVLIRVFYGPVTIKNFFSLVTYEIPTEHNGKPLNTYTSVDLDSPMMDYSYFISNP